MKFKLNEMGNVRSPRAQPPSVSVSAVPNQAPARINFIRSNTCGSFFAKCQCPEPHRGVSLKSISLDATSPVPSILISESESEKFVCDNKVRTESKSSEACKTESKSTQFRIKKYPSFTHPDTPVIFTEENRYPDPSSTAAFGRRASREIFINDGNQKIEIKHSKRASSPNIIGTSDFSYDIHPEFKVQVVPKSPTFGDIPSCGSHHHSHQFQHFHHQHNHLNHHRKPCLLKKNSSKSKSFPSVSSSTGRISSSSLRQHSYESDATFSSFSVDEESEDAELNENVSDLLTTDLNESSTSLSSSNTSQSHSSKSTTIEIVQKQNSPPSSGEQIQHISAEKYFQVW